MKNITFVLLFISFNSLAQVSLPVYYTIPPTVAGCDGLVAIDTRNLIFGNCIINRKIYLSKRIERNEKQNKSDIFHGRRLLFNKNS